MIEMTIIESPVGPLTIAARDGRTCLLHFGADREAAVRTLRKWYGEMPIDETEDPNGTVTVLRRYFGGDLDALDDVDVEMNGTSFQQRVWAALREVKAGHTASYATVAKNIGSASAVRAVGAANGANPVAIVVPCHRIVGSDGTLTGYGGGLERKEWLLRHERGSLFP